MKRLKFLTRDSRGWLVAMFLLVVYFLGGGSRSDIVSLPILRFFSWAVFVFAALSVPSQTIRRYRFLVLYAAGLVAVVALHLVPLPPTLWSALPGRGVLAEVERIAGLEPAWRPLAMVPAHGWNAFFSLGPPLATLAIVIALDAKERERLSWVLVGMGMLTCIIGIAQISGPAHSPLYFYRITNFGDVVGLFSNRNHNAIFLACLFPLLAVLASRDVADIARLRANVLVLAAFAAMLTVSLLLIGSRAGLAIGLISALLSLPLLRPGRIQRRSHIAAQAVSPDRLRYAKFAIGAVLLAAGATIVFLSDLPIVDRLFRSGGNDELRLRVVGPISRMTWEYFPFGSGFGSFAEVFQIGEPHTLVRSTYLNHAHNDWLEIALTGGLPALLLALTASIAWALASWRAFVVANPRDEGIPLARAGSLIILLLALSSAVDYPLRTPSLACVFVIASVWLAGTGRTNCRKSPDESR